ncbi:hypothetical protein DO70_4896 [Burkholderia pseudomallei]|nr:hypothetical protein DP56_5730 [Burkholderia pseudomallei]KGD24342.1 hypothetical protein DO70_4896 [Burkholderia pseudomallei]
MDAMPYALPGLAPPRPASAPDRPPPGEGGEAVRTPMLASPRLRSCFALLYESAPTSQRVASHTGQASPVRFMIVRHFGGRSDSSDP